MNLRTFFPAILAAAVLAVPTVSQAGKHHGGGGNWGHGNYRGGHGYYGGRGYYGRPYGFYGYRPWGYGYGWGPSIGFSFYSRPTYATYSSRVYRGSIADDSLAVDVQRALRSRGYYRGSIDGVIGAESRAAIRAYQRNRGMSQTGRIDRALLDSLRIG